jgi:hypothetical protein
MLSSMKPSNTSRRKVAQTMRRWTTWLLLGALAALASVAVADAVRGRAETRKVSAPTISVPLIPRNEPAASAMSGVLYYSDRVDCRLRGLRLPDLSEVRAPELRSCRFSISPDGRTALSGDAAWSPEGGMYARASDGLIELGSPASKQTLRFPGRAPAFRPDGTFTYVRGHEVVAWSTSCPPGARLFTLPEDNATVRCRKTIARFQRDRPILSLAWMSNTRMAVITKPSEWVLTIRKGRLRASTIGFGRPLTDLHVSPRGSFVAARAEGRGGLLVLGPDGLAAALPSFTSPRALTWSPDERWTAVATENSVFVFRTNTGEAGVRRLPIHAYQVAWR